MQTNELLIQKVSQFEAVLTGMLKDCRVLKTTIAGGVSTSPNSKKSIREAAAQAAVDKRNARLYKKKPAVGSSRH